MRVFVTLLFFLLLIFIKTSVFAQDTPSSSAFFTATETAKVDYELSYPGILPDNPLYIFKAVRDKVVSFLITDPLKKAEFDLVTSDKRFYAALFLTDKDKDTLAISTISKGNNYFEDAISKIFEAKKQKIEVSQYLVKLNLAALKHKEVLSDIKKKIDPKYILSFEIEEKRVTEYIKTVSSHLPK